MVDGPPVLPPSPARALAERLGHYVPPIRRRLPAPLPRLPFYASSEGGLRYLRPSLRSVDARLLAAVSHCVRDGDVVWDIGANVGLFSLAAAATAGPDGQVIAIEADTWLVELLRRTARRPGARAPIDVLPVAISDAVGLAVFHIAKRNRSTNFLDGFGTTQTGGSRERRPVVTVSLDWMLDVGVPIPDVVKIDVEGAEVLALRGAAQLLESRPILILEVAGANVQTVCDLLVPWGYKFFDGDDPEFSPVDKPTEATLAIVPSGRAPRPPE